MSYDKKLDDILIQLSCIKSRLTDIEAKLSLRDEYRPPSTPVFGLHLGISGKGRVPTELKLRYTGEEYEAIMEKYRHDK